jgi:hypothetical protein
MADLIDRISGEDDSRPKIFIAQFVGGFELYAMNLVTRQEVADDWDLQGDELTQAISLADNLDAEVGISNKLIYLTKIHAISALIENDNDTMYHNQDGTVDKVRVIADMGF